MKTGYALISQFIFLWMALSAPVVFADALASSGTPADPNVNAVITVNTDAPNPYTTGIGSGSQSNGITVEVLPGAELLVSTHPGIHLHSTSTVNNDGSVTATTAGQPGILGVNGNTVSNTGTITAVGDALSLGGNNVVHHSGTITSSAGSGVVALSDNTVTVDGSINAVSRGIHALDRNTLTVHGSITAGNIGIYGGDDNTLTNTGTITGGSGISIYLGSGTNSLTLDTGSILNGTVIGGTGTDRLVLQGTGTEDDVFQGFEFLTMTGTDWTLSGDSTFTVASIQQGILHVDGTLTANTNVSAGATLGGGGTLQGTVTNDGTLRPGNSVGTMAISGSLVQGAGSVLEIETAGGYGDQVQVSGAPGTAALAGTLQLVPSGPDVSYSALTTTGGVTGTFDTVTQTSPRVQSMVTYTASNVNVTTLSPAGMDARTDMALSNGTLFLDTLSGRLHGMQGVVTHSRRSPTASLHGPYQSTKLGSNGFWFRGLGRNGERDMSDGVLGSQTRLGGLVLGGDRRLSEQDTLGGALAFTRGDAEVDQDAGSSTADNIMLGIYYGYERPTSETAHVFFDAALGGGINNYNTRRNVFNQGSGTAAMADFDGTTLGARIAGGMGFDMGRTTLRPVGIVDYIWARQDAYNEYGAGSANTQYDSQAAQALKLAAILALDHSFQISASTLTPEIRIGVAHEMALDDRSVGAEVPGLGGAFTLQGNDKDETRGVLGLGGSWWFQDSVSAFLDARGEFGSETKTYTLSGGMRFLF